MFGRRSQKKILTTFGYTITFLCFDSGKFITSKNHNITLLYIFIYNNNGKKFFWDDQKSQKNNFTGFRELTLIWKINEYN